jgi:predicted aconitase with swiveling domain
MNLADHEKKMLDGHGKGSTAGSYTMHAMSKRKTGPRGMINPQAEPT